MTTPTKLRTLWGLLLIVACSLSVAFAQETTASLQGYVKDPSGAVVANAKVEVTSPALLVPKSTTTDSTGYYRFSNLPVGTYELAVSAQGFSSYKQVGIELLVGKLPTINVEMKLGATSETVEVSGAAPLVDPTTSKVAVAISEQTIQDLPKTRQFYSLIGFAPGARQEPLQSNSRGGTGFQIDGASDGENVYMIDGMDTTDIQSGGLGRVAQTLNTDFVQEVQIKSSGFEAEYGGALGGVVNVIQKRGSNQWHGSLFTAYRGNQTYASDAPSLRLDPSTVTNAATRTSAKAQYYQPKEDNWRIVEPGFTVGGPILHNHLSFFTGFDPNLSTLTRTVNFTRTGFVGPRSFTQHDDTYNWQTRLDANITSRLHLFGSWIYAYERATGISLPGADSAYGQVNNSAGTDPTTYRPDRGYVRPDYVLQFGGDYQLTNRILVSGRIGYWYQNYGDRGLPVGNRHTANNSSKVLTGFDGTPIPAAFQLSPGFQDIGGNQQYLYDQNTRRSMSYDVSYYKSGFLGTHNFKFGYSNNRLANSVNNGYNTSWTQLHYGEAYSANSDAGKAACATLAAGPGKGVCAGNYGYYIVSDYSIYGNVSSYNHALYGQDAWTIGHGITLNLGIRFDKENVPPYTPGAGGVNFGWTDKVAPRIGGAWDVTGNGKWKLYASYGKFFDIMKYGLPRGSFGGEFWHDCVFSMDNPDYTTIQPARTQPGGHYCNGGAGGTHPGSLIEEFNYRAVIVDPTNPGVDPNIQPLQQHEFVVGLDHEMTPTVGLSVRYARKRLDRAIEDNGVDIAGAEVYFIGNPGYGIVSNLLQKDVKDSTSVPFITYPAQCPTCPLEPRAERRYDGLEVRVTKRYGHNWFGSAQYVYSQLRGNYSGLTSTSLSDTNSSGELVGGGGGRHTAGNGRAFDLPQMQFTTGGRVLDGPLPTDRPHTLNVFGSYHFDWFGHSSNETTLGLSQAIYSGTPLGTVIPAVSTSSAVQYYGLDSDTFLKLHADASGNFVSDGAIRGYRTPAYTQTDAQISHEVKVSKTNEAMRLRFTWNVLNLLNQHARMGAVTNPVGNSGSHVEPLLAGGSVDWLALTKTGWDPVQWLNNPNAPGAGTTNVGKTLNSLYGLTSLFQSSRAMYGEIKFVF